MTRWHYAGVTHLLYFKPELRGFSQRLTRRDLVAVLQFSVLTFIVLPILPNQDFGPYNAFNPYQAWMMVVLIPAGGRLCRCNGPPSPACSAFSVAGFQHRTTLASPNTAR
jgi:hypothetical protein